MFFYYVILTEVLHHLEDKDVEKIMKYVKGKLILIEPIFVNPFRFAYKVFFKNFKDYGLAAGFGMLKPFFIPRVGMHLSREKYFSKDKLDDLFKEYNIVKRSFVNDHFYFMEVK